MNTDIQTKTSHQLPESAKEIAKQATVDAQHTTDAVENLVKDSYQSMLSKLEQDAEQSKGYAQKAINVTKETFETSKKYVRQNPVPVVLGAVGFGVAMGFMLMMARRKPAFGERFADDPLVAVREAILGGLAPVTQRVNKGFDSARDGAGKVLDRVHHYSPSCNSGSFTDHLGRIGSNLKFW